MSADTEIHSIDYGRTEIQFSLQRRERKTLEIGVCPTMVVEVVAPLNAALDSIKQKVRKRASWIRKQLRYFDQFQPFTPAQSYVSGASHLYLGRQYRLKVVPHIQKGVKLSGGHIVVQTHRPMSSEETRQLVEEWFLERAHTKFSERLFSCFGPFEGHGHAQPKLIIRKMKRRWGSHTRSGNIILNPRLLRASVNCIDYVVTHELCHLEHKDHSSGFYDLLEAIMPDWEKRKMKLEKRLA